MGTPAVVASAQITCSFGVAPSALMVLPIKRIVVEGRPAANIGDSAPMVNILPFGMCSSPANPTVIAATAAALGVLTPMPCVPATAGPWTPGAPMTVLGGLPAVTSTSTCICTWGGVITVINPSTTRTTEA